MAFPKMLTLTMPRTTGDPGEGIDLIRARFNDLRALPVFSKVEGGVYQIELKPKPDGWHVHMHVILDCPYLPKQKVFSAWTALFSVPYLNIDIKAAKTEAEQAYVAKYAAKAADYEGEIPQVVSWYLATKGKRLFSSFGSWYNQEPPADNADESAFPEKFACPSCGMADTCVAGECVRFVVGKDAAPAFEKQLSGCGPPRVSRW